MREVSANLFIANQEDEIPDGVAVINAAKAPWHMEAIGYTKSLPADHPNYLIHETDDVLTLNMIDPKFELKAEFTDPMLRKAISFIKKNIKTRPVVVRCNQGMSRSPSIALVYLAKTDEIVNENYSAAAEDFKQIYPEYSPGDGIAAYLKNGWERLI